MQIICRQQCVASNWPCCIDTIYLRVNFCWSPR